MEASFLPKITKRAALNLYLSFLIQANQKQAYLNQILAVMVGIIPVTNIESGRN